MIFVFWGGGSFPSTWCTENHFRSRAVCFASRQKEPLDKQYVHAVSNCSVTANRQPSLQTVRRLCHQLFIWKDCVQLKKNGYPNDIECLWQKTPCAGRKVLQSDQVNVGFNIALDISAEPGSSWPWDRCAKQSPGVLISVKSQLLFLYLLHWRDLVTNTISQTETAFGVSSNEKRLEAAKWGRVCCDSRYVGSQQPTQPSSGNFRPKHAARRCPQGPRCWGPEPWVTNHSNTQGEVLWRKQSMSAMCPQVKEQPEMIPCRKTIFQHYRLDKLRLHSCPAL